MARTHKKGTAERSLASRIFRIFRISVLSVSVAGVLFSVGFGLDYYLRLQRESQGPRPLLPDDDGMLTETPGGETAGRHAAGSGQQLSFYDTLVRDPPEKKSIVQERQEKIMELQRSPAEEEKQPVSLSEASGAGRHDRKKTADAAVVFTIQLGSFSKSIGARTFSERLAEKGYDPYIIKVHVPGKGTVYRVRVGRFTSMEEAQKLATIIEKKENMSVLITSR